MKPKKLKLVNPIYDAAFKYLLEDTAIAKGLIGRIIKEDIEELSIQPQELHVQSDKYIVVILRIDFKAVIKTKEGKFKKVLIEIQKGKVESDVVRFRRYLGTNYRQQDEVKKKDGTIEKQSLPIIPIYFLGFRLEKIKTPAMRVHYKYEDLVTNLELNEKEDFVEKLSHQGYFIQIPRLHKKHRNDLEHVLKVFNQSYKISGDNRLIEISEKEINKDPLLKAIGERLAKATADDQLLAEMEVEEEVEEMIEKYIRENQILKDKNKDLEKKSKTFEKKSKTFEKKSKTLEGKNEELKTAFENSIIQFILHTEFSDEEIAAMQNIDVEYVKKLRVRVEKEE